MASTSSSMETCPSVSSVTFPRARVYWSTQKERNEPQSARICVSTSLRWIFVDSHDSAGQVDLSSFRGKYCLSLERLVDTAVWEDVEKVVVPFDNESGPGFFVHGELTYPDAWRTGRRSVEVDIVFDTADERNTVMEQVRIRVSPWQLLYRRMKEAMRSGKLSDKLLKDLSDWADSSTGTAEDHVSAKSFPFVGALEEGAKGVNMQAEFLQAAATIVKKSMENSAVALSQDAQDVNEHVKCVTFVSSVVKILVIATKLVELYAEMKHGNKEWLCIHARVEDLCEVIVKRIVSILYLDGHADEIVVMNMFEVQQELIDVVSIIEGKLMRCSGPIEMTMQFWKANEVKKIEDDLERQQLLWLNVVQADSIARNSKLLKDMERDLEELKKNTEPHADQFKRHFDSPYLPSNLVFDFESYEDHNRVSTPESILLRSVLYLRSRGSLQGASALGTHGMGGVGKTTALKAICSSENVQSKFKDGVCFMEFGEDATVQKVRAEISRCVKKFGGKEVVKETRRASSLRDVVNQAAEWLKDRVVLLVCDDLWPTDVNELGYVLELKEILRDAPQSGLLISTRYRTIANAVSDSPVSFDCVDPERPIAREILGKAGFGDNWEEIISSWDAESEYVKILRMCAGLPLALGIAGAGLREYYEDSLKWDGREDASFAVKTYWHMLKKSSLKHLRGANADYHRDGLKCVVESSLKSCEAWGRSSGRNYDTWRLFRSLCILEKQQFLPESTLMLYWRLEGLDEMQVREVVRKFAHLNFVKRERLGRSIGKKEQFGVRLHDLVLELCKNMEVDEQQVWHIRLINAYTSVLEEGKVMETSSRAWWKMEDDGYMSKTLSRHLIAAGCWSELETLLCDVRWTLRRYEMGGWAALDMDFKRLLAYEGGSVDYRIRKLHTLLKRCWDWLGRDQSLFAFYVFGHLSKQERQECYISEYLKSLTEHFQPHWLCPLAKCVGPEDNREISEWNIGYVVIDLVVSWSIDRVVVASCQGINVWSLIRQEELFSISIDRDAMVRSIELSEDLKIIVSGHQDGTVRRWNVNTGDSIGKPVSGNSKAVLSVAIRGNLIVSGSDDGLLFRWNATTGESIGSALQGHGDSVSCVAVSADGKLIVSASRDGTIRKWDGRNRDSVRSLLKTYHEGVTSLAISSDGELVVSGHKDGTVRRWRAGSGEAVGEPFRGHNDWIYYLAVSEDGNRIVSCSYDYKVCLWDTLSGEAIGVLVQRYESLFTCVALSSDGKLLSGSQDRTVRQWDVSAKRNVTEQLSLSTIPDEVRSDSIRRSIVSLSLCANGRFVVSCSEDGTLQRWDMLTGEAVGRPMLGHAEGNRIDSVAISRDGTLIVSRDNGGIVRWWDSSTGEAIGEPMDEQRKDMLNEMERARLCGDQECDAVVRKYTFPIEMECRAVCSTKKKIVLGLRNGNVAICERR